LGLKFDTRKHSRYKESEADSMAIVFMSKTMFDAQEAINLLGILDTLDKDSFDAENCLKITFQSVEYPFKNNWLEKEEGLLGGHANIKEDEKLADSLKTHPDCKVRIEFVKKLLLQYTQNNAQKSFINPQYFNVLQNTLPLENLAYFYEKKYYSTAFYQCLKQLQQQPNSPYLVTTIGNLYNGFYDAQKQHHLNRVATLPYPGNSNSFNLTLQFIQNVNLEDYKNINVNFLKKYETKLSKFPAFSNTLAQAKKS